MMSRKHYVALAAEIRTEVMIDEPAMLADLTRRIAAVLEADNPHFDRDRFIAAALGREGES